MDISFITQDLRDLRAHFNQHGFDLRLVGGVVRDTLAGLPPKDLDLATDAKPHEQVEIYNAHGYRWIGTGMDHGTITVMLGDEPHEITSLRVDVETDGRHAKVAFTSDWEADLGRRDLTINAMAMTFDGRLIDPFGGADDLANGVVRFVGNAEARIREDYLRILRFYRFYGRFGRGGIDSQTRQAIASNVYGLQQISRERIWSEFQKILPQAASPAIMIDMVQGVGINHHIDLPYNNVSWPRWWLHKALTITNDPAVLMAAWCCYDPVNVESVAKSWKWSNADRDHAMWLCNNVRCKRDLRWLIAVEGAPREWVAELAALEERDGWEQNALVQWVFAPFPVNGNDLIAAGVKPGAAMGKMLRMLKESWAHSSYSATKEELLKLI